MKLLPVAHSPGLTRARWADSWGEQTKTNTREQKLRLRHLDCLHMINKNNFELAGNMAGI